VNTNKFNIARISSAAAIAAIFFATACGTQQGAPAKGVSVEAPKQAHPAISADMAERQALESLRRHYEAAHGVSPSTEKSVPGQRFMGDTLVR
jgi:hypothetical protein